MFCCYCRLNAYSKIHVLRKYKYSIPQYYIIVKVPRWGTSALQPKAYCALTPKEFLHSSLEALHTERYAAPQLAKERTM
jgi:hypothetical protein